MMTDFDYILDIPWIELKRQRIGSLGDLHRTFPELIHDPRLIDVHNSSINFSFFGIRFWITPQVQGHRFCIYEYEDYRYYTSKFKDKFDRYREFYDSLVETREEMLASLWLVSDLIIDDNQFRDNFREVFGTPLKDLDEFFTEIVNFYHDTDNRSTTLKNLFIDYENQLRCINGSRF